MHCTCAWLLLLSVARSSHTDLNLVFLESGDPVLIRIDPELNWSGKSSEVPDSGHIRRFKKAWFTFFLTLYFQEAREGLESETLWVWICSHLPSCKSRVAPWEAQRWCQCKSGVSERRIQLCIIGCPWAFSSCTNWGSPLLETPAKAWSLSRLQSSEGWIIYDTAQLLTASLNGTWRYFFLRVTHCGHWRKRGSFHVRDS